MIQQSLSVSFDCLPAIADENRRSVNEPPSFAFDVQVLPFDEVCAQQVGKLRGEFLRTGVSVSAVDLMIGSVALVHDLTLVTHNVSDFQKIPGLRLVDWLTP